MSYLGVLGIKKFENTHINDLSHISIQLPQSSVCTQTDGGILCQLCQLAVRTPTAAEWEHSSFLPRNLDWEDSDMLWTCQAPGALQKESVVFVLIFMNECRVPKMNHDFCSTLARRQQPDPHTNTQNVCLHSLPHTKPPDKTHKHTGKWVGWRYGCMKCVCACLYRFCSRQKSLNVTAIY